MYISGSASSFADLQTAIFDACTANGFTKDGNVIYKQDGYFEIAAETDKLVTNGGQNQSGGVLSNKSSFGTCIGGSFINFPINYEINIFDDPSEVYVVINYNTDYYQMLSFGTSGVLGSGNKGWLTGTFYSSISPQNIMPISGTVINDVITLERSNDSLSPGLFVTYGGGYSQSISIVLSNINGSYEWINKSSFKLGSSTLVASLLHCCPSAFNSATPLLPIKAVASLPDNGQATIANPVNARFCRIDYNDPGSIITYGNEKWKIYPWLKKNAEVRNGADSGDPDHSGTFGYAIKYTGT